MIEEIGTLQSWTDFAPNLFEVTLFGVDTNTTSTSKSVPNIQRYCTAFSLPPAGLELERHELSKRFFLKKYQFSDEVTITWKEDEALSIYRYHDEWIHSFYDRTSDVYKSGSEGKKRNMKIVFQRFNRSDSSNIGLDNMITTFEILIEGLIPTKGVPLEGDWSKDSSEHTRQINYKFDRWSLVTKDLTRAQIFNMRYD